MPHDVSWPPSDPTEVQLHVGDAHLAVALCGGGLRQLVVGDWAVLDGYPAGTVPQGRRGGVLLPWPNRLRNGRWTWAGEELQLPVASPDSPHAVHGVVSWQPWTVLAAADATVSVGTVVEARPGYPFRLAAAVDYVLAADRLDVTVRVRNLGSVSAPFGAGMHPYLHVGAHEDGGIGGADLTVPARAALDVEGGLPTGRTHEFSGNIGRIGSRAFDDTVTDLVRDDDGWAHVRLRGPLGELVLAVDDAWPWLQVYTADQLPEGQWRRSLAVEPMTCPPNALADGTDLVVLDPGAAWSGSWSLSWTAS